MTGIYLAKAGPAFYFRHGRTGLKTVPRDNDELYGLRTAEFYVAIDPPKVSGPLDLTNFSRIGFAIPFNDRLRLGAKVPEQFWDDSNHLFFRSSKSLVQAIEIQIPIASVDILVPVVAIYGLRRQPQPLSAWC